MTDQEHSHVTDLLAAQDALIHWCETLITAHADLVELASEADLLNTVDTDEHEQRLTETHGVIEAHRHNALGNPYHQATAATAATMVNKRITAVNHHI